MSYKHLSGYILNNNNIKKYSSFLDKNFTSTNDVNILYNITNHEENKENKHLESKSKLESDQETVHVSDIDYFTPELNDKLFWCFYIIYYGIETYEINKDIEFKIEKDFKINVISKIREKKDILKKYKIKKNDLEDEFINQHKITHKGLFALCLIYDINICYIWDHKYIEMIHCDNNIYIITLKDRKPSVLIPNSQEKIEGNKIINNILNDCRKNNWKIENINKPLKGISSYTLPQLKEIATYLKIDKLDKNNKPKAKKYLYAEILENM